MQYKKGICSNCGRERFFVNVRLSLCSICNSERTKANRKPIKALPKFSSKGFDIQKKYIEMCKEFDRVTPKVCVGCGKKEGEVMLSHSHIISRADAKGIGMPELIYDKNNIQYLCLSMGDNHIGCHLSWESKSLRTSILCYQKNIEYISKISSELYFKYKV